MVVSHINKAYGRYPIAVLARSSATDDSHTASVIWRMARYKRLSTLQDRAPLSCPLVSARHSRVSCAALRSEPGRSVAMQLLCTFG